MWQGQPRGQRYYDEVKKEEILPPMVPYDNAGWTMPLLMGVDSRMMSSPLKVAMHQVAEVKAPDASVTGSGPQIVFSRADNGSFRAVNRIQKAGGRMSVAATEFTLGGTKHPAGTFIVESASLPAASLREIASATRVPMTAGVVSAKSNPLPLPRIGLYLSWQASMDAGWISLLFDEYEFPYTGLRDADVRAGNLRNRYDVIVLPDQSAESILSGHRTGTMPDNYLGGMTETGAANLKRFVEQGGTLVCNKASLELAVQLFNLPVSNVLRGVGQRDFYVPGSILRVDFDTAHPLAYGMEANGYGYISGAHAFEIGGGKTKSEEGNKEEGGKAGAETAAPADAMKVVARFPDEPLLASGFVVGEERLRGKAVVIETSVGQGRVVLFGFNVQNRAQSYVTHKLLYNAVFSGSAIAGR
jgi:hypothetical protein